MVFWGTFFPLISEAVTGDEASVGPPWFDRYIVPLALVLVLLSGIGPVIAWRRATAANAAPQPARCPALVGVRRRGAAARARRRRGSPSTALLMFALGAFVIAGVGAGVRGAARARGAR